MIEPITRLEALTKLRNDSLFELVINEINVIAIQEDQVAGVVAPSLSAKLTQDLFTFKTIVTNIKRRIGIIDKMMMKEAELHGKN